MMQYPKKFSKVSTKHYWFDVYGHDNWGISVLGWAKSLDLVEIGGRPHVKAVPWYPELYDDNRVIFIACDALEAWSPDSSCI